MKVSGTLFLMFFISISLFAQPLSDDCDAIIDLGEAPVCTGDIYTNVNATLTEAYTDPSFNIPSCWNIVNHDVWFNFTVPADGSIIDFIVTITGTENGPSSNGIFQPHVALYRGNCQVDGLSELFCSEAILGENQVQLIAEGLTPGLTYFLRIDDVINTASPNWGDFEICIEEYEFEVQAVASSDTICFNTAVDVMATVVGDFTSIEWAPAFLFNDATVEQPTLNNPLFQTTTFTVTVTADNITITDDVTVYVSDPLVFINQTSDATCTGICNGSAQADVIGSLSSDEDINYLWSNGANSSTASDLCGGSYSLTVTDGIGCTAFTNTTINEAVFTALAFSTTDPCDGGMTGSATALAIEGTEPFTYLWSNNETTQDVDNLTAGVYEVTVTDANDCNDVASVEIQINPIYVPVITASASEICPGEEITISVASPPTGTMLNWSTGETTTSITVSPAESTTYTLSSSTISENIIRNGDFENGYEDFTNEYDLGFGGTWGLLSSEGTYAVDMNTANVHNNFPFCTDYSGTGNMLIVNGSSQPDAQLWCQPVIVSPNTDYLFSTWAMTVIGENPAVLQFSIGNELLGTPFNLPSTTCDWNSFNETWNSGNNTAVTICIVNQNTLNSGNDFALDNISLTPICTGYDEVDIDVSILKADIIDQSNVTCQGNLGTAQLNTIGTFPPYTYLWDNGESTALATQLEAGIHQVTISDSINCEIMLTVQINTDPQISIDSLIVTELICGEVIDNESTIINASINIVNSIGNPPFQYSINGVDFQDSSLFENLDAGEYELTVQDTDGCIANSSTSISPLIFPPFPIITLSAEDFCSTTSSIELSVENANLFDRISWSTGEEESMIFVDQGGTYVLSAFNEYNCLATTEVFLEECVRYEIPNIFSPNNDGVNDVFKIFHTENGFEFNSLKVFNRWGQVVFETSSDEVWDGTVDGKAAPADVFIYQAVFKLNGDTQEERGSLTLVR